MQYYSKEQMWLNAECCLKNKIYLQNPILWFFSHIYTYQNSINKIVCYYYLLIYIIEVRCCVTLSIYYYIPHSTNN